MGSLRIPILEIGDAGYVVNAAIECEALCADDGESVQTGTIAIEGDLTELGGDYLFRGRVRGAYCHSCVRCLEAASAPFDIEVTWIFAQGVSYEPLDELEDEPDEDNESRPFPIDGDEIDLAVPAWEEVQLSAPTKFLCKDDCAGLCPRCGTNLNMGSCSCAPEDEDVPIANTGFAALKDMFPEMNQEKSED